MGNFKWQKIIHLWAVCHVVGASSSKWRRIAPGLVLHIFYFPLCSFSQKDDPIQAELLLNWWPSDESEEHAVRELFNCSQLFSVAAPVDTDCSPSDSDLLVATDSEEELLGTTSDESDDSILLASDVEDQPPPKRKYQTRRSQITFLGKEVCVHALQALIGLGSSTLQRRTSLHEQETQDCAETSYLWIHHG